MIVYTNKHKIPFQIDEEDYETISYYSWSVGHGYVKTTVPSLPGSKHRTRSISLHVFILGNAPDGYEWDHRNRDTLDNRRENLRAVSHVINKRNEGLIKSNQSGVRGVSQFITRKGKKQWQASIRVGSDVRVFLGLFNTLEEAAEARKDAEEKFWGNER